MEKPERPNSIRRLDWFEAFLYLEEEKEWRIVVNLCFLRRNRPYCKAVWFSKHYPPTKSIMIWDFPKRSRVGRFYTKCTAMPECQGRSSAINHNMLAITQNLGRTWHLIRHQKRMQSFIRSRTGGLTMASTPSAFERTYVHNAIAYGNLQWRIVEDEGS